MQVHTLEQVVEEFHAIVTSMDAGRMDLRMLRDSLKDLANAAGQCSVPSRQSYAQNQMIGLMDWLAQEVGEHLVADRKVTLVVRSA